MIDKFTKWIKAWLITKITSKQAMKFVTNIVHRFGVPNSIITDNNTQFTGSRFLEFYDEYHIHIDWTAMTHPRENAQVKRANGMIMQGLKSQVFTHLKQLDQQWSQTLTIALWSLRMTQTTQ
jgi:hypothetical protein